MKFLCVLLSLFLCCSMIAFASPVSEGRPMPGDVSDAPFGSSMGDRPKMPSDGEVPEGFPQDGSHIPQIPADGSFQTDGEFLQDEFRRPNFSDMGEGGFQPPQGGGFPAFGGRDNPWQQNAENQAEENGLSLFLKEYSILLVSLGVLAIAFIFVGLYRRRHY